MVPNQHKHSGLMQGPSRPCLAPLCDACVPKQVSCASEPMRHHTTSQELRVAPNNPPLMELAHASARAQPRTHPSTSRTLLLLGTVTACCVGIWEPSMCTRVRLMV